MGGVSEATGGHVEGEEEFEVGEVCVFEEVGDGVVDPWCGKGKWNVHCEGIDSETLRVGDVLCNMAFVDTVDHVMKEDRLVGGSLRHH